MAKILEMLQTIFEKINDNVALNIKGLDKNNALTSRLLDD